jgi:hypothetical protein
MDVVSQSQILSKVIECTPFGKLTVTLSPTTEPNKPLHLYWQGSKHVRGMVIKLA